MKILKSYRVLFLILAIFVIYLYFNTANEEVTELLPLMDVNESLLSEDSENIQNKNTDENLTDLITKTKQEYLFENGSIIPVIRDDNIYKIIDNTAIEKNYIVQHHYNVDEYFDTTCDYRAASSRISVDISYPQVKLRNKEIVEKKINLKLQELSMYNQIENSTTYKITSEVRYFQDNLLSVVFKGQLMHCADRHPYTWYSTVNFNIKEAYQYKIEDVFDKLTLSLLRLKIKEYFIRNYPNNVENLSFDEVDLFDDFTLSEESITVYFDMYQIGAGYFDSTQATISLKDLIINERQNYE